MEKEIHLFNSLASKKELFVPIDSNHIKMYVCGPTVYSSPHLGNARSTVVYDLLFRVLQYLYPKVTYVRNITDVDDKINAAALERKISIQELTAGVLAEFHNDMMAIGNLDPTIEPNVVDNLSDIIAMISTLIKNGYAYEKEGHVFFSVKKYQDYGMLSGRKIEDLISGSRVEVSPYKIDPEDFVLWKPSKETDDKSSIFESPWGHGRPGWHIECSVMSTKYLGKNFDIHGGGADLKFPHHENEIAQSRCAHLGSDYAKYWVHNGFLTVNGDKMSKSLGNFITVRELLDGGIKGRVLRYIFLTTHYRKPLDYNFKVLEDARKHLLRFDNIIENFDRSELSDISLPDKFLDPLLDDLNISVAMSYLYELTKNIDSEPGNIKYLAKILDFMGLYQNFEEVKIPEEILKIAKDIQNCRINKDYSAADKLRDEIVSKGYHISYDKSGEVIVKNI